MVEEGKKEIKKERKRKEGGSRGKKGEREAERRFREGKEEVEEGMKEIKRKGRGREGKEEIGDREVQVNEAKEMQMIKRKEETGKTFDLRVSYLYISWGCPVSCRASPACRRSSPPRTRRTRRSCGCWRAIGS